MQKLFCDKCGIEVIGHIEVKVTLSEDFHYCVNCTNEVLNFLKKKNDNYELKFNEENI